MAELVVRFRISFFVLGLSVLGPTPADASKAIPHYDPDEYCEQVAGAGGSYSEETKQSCIEMEQQAYDSLKETWDDVPDKMQKYCDDVASSGGTSSYETLKSCIEQEEEAAEKNRTTHFKY